MSLKEAARQGRAAAVRKKLDALTVKTSIRLDRELWKRAHVLAMDEGVELQTIIGWALAAYLDSKGKLLGRGGKR